MYTQVYVLLSYSLGTVSRKKEQETNRHNHNITFPYFIIIIKQFKHFYISS